MPSRTLRPRLFAPLALAALLAGTAACGSDHSSTAPASDPPSATDSASPTPSHTPSESPSEPASASESSSATPPAPAIDALLLPSSGLPGFNDTWDWAVQGTGPQRAPFGICQRFPMDTLGAESTVVRRYQPAGDLSGGSGGHLVSRFVDDKSASQALQVLASWHDRCRERLSSYSKKQVDKVVTVPTSRGVASWYLVTYAKAGAEEGRFDALGVLRDGTTIELLQLNLTGQDYGYEPGQEPMVKALKNAADRLPA